MSEISFRCFSFALSEQLPTAHSLNTSFGELELDEEMKEAVKKVLLPILERRIDESLTFEAV